MLLAVWLVLQAHGIQVSQAHRSEIDAKAALMLLSKQDPFGVPYFADLVRIYDDVMLGGSLGKTLA